MTGGRQRPRSSSDPRWPSRPRRAVPLRTAVLLVAMASVAAACGLVGGGDGASASPPPAGPTSSEQPLPGDLGDCPDPIVVQTDWYPQPEFGSLYHLTAGQGRIDAETGVFRGPLAADPSILLEIRSGAPYVDFQSPVALAADDEDILLAMIDTDEAIAVFEEIPTTAVVAPLDRSPRMLMWDPETYEIEGWPDVDESGATISHLPDAYYVEYLVSSGLVTRIQLEDTYDGSATRFISQKGRLIQEGTVTRDPFNYFNYFEDWGRPVGTLLIHDTGYTSYDGALAVLADRLDRPTRSCLQALVPVIQQSIVDYQQDPSATNQMVLGLVWELDTEWKVTKESVFDSVVKMGTEGIVDNGTDQTIGNFDIDRVEEMLLIARDELPDLDVQPGLTSSDLVTNDFIDPSIGL